MHSQIWSAYMTAEDKFECLYMYYAFLTIHTHLVNKLSKTNYSRCLYNSCICSTFLIGNAYTNAATTAVVRTRKWKAQHVIPEISKNYQMKWNY